jgi:hypothetical protein
MNWKEFLRTRLSYYPGIRLEGLMKITNNLSQDSRSPSRNCSLNFWKSVDK